MRKANYDKFPATEIDGTIWTGWDMIREEIQNRVTATDNNRFLIVVGCYQGGLHEELRKAFAALDAALFIDTKQLFRSEEEMTALTHRFLTDDRLFGYKADFLSYADYLDADKTSQAQAQIQSTSGLVVVYGHGASVVVPDADLLLYADMARWEIQMRSRRRLADGLGVHNRHEAPYLYF